MPTGGGRSIRPGSLIFELLAEHDISLCLSDHADAPAPTVTADWVYIRNHGPGGRYHGSYSDGQLKVWADRIWQWRREGRDVWCFFDNEVKSAVPADAAKLLDMLGAPADAQAAEGKRLARPKSAGPRAIVSRGAAGRPAAPIRWRARRSR